MKRNKMKSKLTLLTLIAAIFFLNIIPVSAEPYVSLNGGFSIDLPDDWEQVDYNTADVFLLNSEYAKDYVTYEAAFSRKGYGPFHEREYLFITIDKIENSTLGDFDRFLNELVDTYEVKLINGDMDDFIYDIKADYPYFDFNRMAAMVYSEHHDYDGNAKSNITFYKHYESGIVSFFFYTPKSTFNENLELIMNVFYSFSTENLEAKIPAEKLKVADIESREIDSDDNIFLTNPIVIIFGIILIIGLIIVIRKFKN